MVALDLLWGFVVKSVLLTYASLAEDGMMFATEQVQHHECLQQHQLHDCT